MTVQGYCDPSAFPLPLLITGITGVAGYSSFQHFSRRFPGRVIGTRPPKTFRFQGPGVVALDTADREGLGELFRKHRFRAVLNATGNCALKACELNDQMARRINVDSARAIVEQVRLWGARLVHLSSDLVFSGRGTGGYRETDPVDPVTVYGKTMVQAERIVATADVGAAIVRISLPMGPSFNRCAGAIDWIESRFREGRPATLYFDEIRTPTYVEDLDRVFEEMLKTDASGIFHAGGPRALSLFQIGQIVNRVGGFPAHLLKGLMRYEAGPIPPRAGNVRMDSTKLQKLLGREPFAPWPADDASTPTGRRWHYDRPCDDDGSPELLARTLYQRMRTEAASWRVEKAANRPA